MKYSIRDYYETIINGNFKDMKEFSICYLKIVSIL